MGIRKYKGDEMVEIEEFVRRLDEYEYMFVGDPDLLVEPFSKILEGIEQIDALLDDSWGA